ncbi:IspD/TarI family cytidylyltransferase [Treponema sp. OMZ 805]|uniref:IspD/TarI family cytidylyltransferase n=1 Tax=Treponema sp. OMZ 805 TaxID=2726068 RepID=UPI003D8F3399
MIWMTKTISMTANNAVLITAAGSSQRFGEKKEFLPLSTDTHTSVLSACLYAFVSAGCVSCYVITVPQGKVETVYSLLAADTRLSSFFSTHRDTLHIVEGGATRQESVYKGLLALADKNITFILVHDGARPWVSVEVITSVLTATEQYGAAVPAIPVTDTQKEVDKTGKIIRHLRRDLLAAVQTPQGFRFEPLLYAHRQACNDGNTYTDDSEIYAQYCGAVYICPGARENKKITYREDL